MKVLERCGEVTELELQPKYDVIVNGVKIGFWKGDFRYWLVKEKQRVIEDVKGVKTPVYRLKKKLVEAIYGIEIVEI